MFQNLSVFQLAHEMARHAGTRQAVIAQNIANADTPGYTAQDVTPFKEIMSSSDASINLRATRDGHMFGMSSSGAPDITDSVRAENAPNGNSITLEEEMLKAVDVKRQHDRALAIYRSSLTILRSSLGRA